MKAVFYGVVIGAFFSFTGYVLVQSSPLTPTGVANELQEVSHRLLMAVGLAYSMFKP